MSGEGSSCFFLPDLRDSVDGSNLLRAALLVLGVLLSRLPSCFLRSPLGFFASRALPAKAPNGFRFCFVAGILFGNLLPLVSRERFETNQIEKQ